MVPDPCSGPDHEHPVHLHLSCDLRPHDRDLCCDRTGAYPAGDHGQQRVAQHRAELFEVFAGAGFPSVPDYDCRGHLRGADTQHFGRGGHCRGYLGLHGLHRAALFLSVQDRQHQQIRVWCPLRKERLNGVCDRSQRFDPCKIQSLIRADQAAAGLLRRCAPHGRTALFFGPELSFQQCGGPADDFCHAAGAAVRSVRTARPAPRSSDSGNDSGNNSDTGSNAGIVTTVPTGRLQVSGTKLTDESGNIIQLRGVSTHGISWFPDYVNYDAFATLRDDWGANVVRIAMYPEEYNGYLSGGDKAALKQIIDNGVNYATELGMYVIIDWHVLNYAPSRHTQEACDFFAESGNGGIDYASANEWLDFMNSNQLSFIAWSLSNKAETSALISSGCSAKSGWSDGDLSETGRWFKRAISGR